MQARCCPDIFVLLSKIQYRRYARFIDTNTEELIDTLRARVNERPLRVIEIIEVAVRVDQQSAGYMVWVWRSDCSAPAR